MGFRYLRGNQVDAQQSGSEQVRGQGGISEMYACMHAMYACIMHLEEHNIAVCRRFKTSHV